MVNIKKNVLFLFLIGVCATVFAQPIPSLKWSHGDTLDIVKKKNLKVMLDATEKPNQYKVIEGTEPTITETIFTFDSNNRLTNITWRKVGGTRDIYRSLVDEYSKRYIVIPKESEFAPNWKENFASAECSVENNKGNANIQIIAPLDGRYSSYVTLTETYNYKYQPKELVIPNGTTSIEDREFNIKQLTSVIIPNSVASIEYLALGNNYLTSITIPNSVTSIGDSAFSNNYLTSVIIPNSVTSIGDWAFSGNYLTSVTIPSSVISIEDYTFSQNHISSINIPNSVKTIGAGAFSNNFIDSINIPSSVKTIGPGAFRDNFLGSIIIPDSVTEIEAFVFQSNHLTNVTIPNGVTSIGEHAFLENQLTNINIPSSVTRINGGAFKYNKITSITIGSNVELGKDLVRHEYDKDDAFDNKFDDFYRNNGRKAGTYIFANDRWSRR